MDCDRFEATLIDELYDELDELTSAAAKRHVAGCSRCASLIGGLRATRRVAVLPILEPSVDLEDRILAAARQAQNVVPIGRRLSRAVSWAGSWAMRPQTAMAAVFVLMVGSSLLFVRRSKVMAVDSSLTVTAQGEPAGQATATPSSDEQLAFDSKQAAAAHGAGPSTPQASAPVATPAATAAASAWAYGTEGSLALKDAPKEKSRSLAGGGKMDPFGSGSSSLDGLSANAEAPAGAPAQRYAPPPAAMPKRASSGYDDTVVPSDLDKGAATGGGAVAQNQDDARRGQAANDPGAALAQTRAQRDTSGCGSAVGNFDRIADQARGTSTGDNATWEAAECYRRLGQNDQAQVRYQKLLTVPQFKDKAQGAIASLTSSQSQGAVATKAARKAAPPAKPSAVTLAPTTQTPPQAAPATPPAQNAPAADQAPVKQQSGF